MCVCYFNVFVKDFIVKEPFLKRIIRRFKPISPMLAILYLRNGDIKPMIVDAKLPFFIFENKAYLIDEKLFIYNGSMKMNTLHYHEALSIPYKPLVDSSSIKSQVKETGNSNIDMAINPEVLKQFIESEFVQKVMKGAELTKVLDFMKLMIIFNLVASLVIILMLIKGLKIL